MAKKSRKVEFYRVNFSATDNENQNIDFFNFFTQYMSEKSINERFKDVFFKTVENEENYFIGGITTTKNYGIPPKNNYITHQAGALPLGDTEGLGYYNVFLFDKRRKLLLFEHNQNGCWLPTFIDYVKGKRRTIDCPLNISMSAAVVLRNEAYERIRRFSSYSQVEIKLAEPDGIVLSNVDENDSASNAADIGLNLNADTLSLIYKIDKKKSNNSLNDRSIRKLALKARNLMGEHKVLKFAVTGYYTEGSDSDNITKLDTINLVNDMFVRYFSIEEPRVKNDLQENEKKIGIKNVYFDCLPQIRDLFRNNS